MRDRKVSIMTNQQLDLVVTITTAMRAKIKREQSFRLDSTMSHRITRRPPLWPYNLNTEVTVEILDRDNRVTQTMKYSGINVDVKITLRDIAPEPPKRSPLSMEAINREDLKVGLNIRRANTHGISHGRVGMVNGEPFRRGTKYDKSWPTHDHCWMVPVVTTNYQGKLVQEDWYLADMGVVPYTSEDDRFLYWNDQNYTIAV